MSTVHSDKIMTKLQELDHQLAELDRQLLDPEVLADHTQVRSLSIKKAALQPLVAEYHLYRDIEHQIRELQTMIADDGDAEIVQLARDELQQLQEQQQAQLESLQQKLVTSDERTVGSIILEVRAGVGGDEAAIWAGDLLQMYERFAAERSWTVRPIQHAPAEQGGFKQATVSVTGDGVWAELGYEGGTHQVKRVPVTEAQGRVHTSTATVAVLPEPEAVQVTIDPGDVKEMITTSQGPGGQNVNKVATAVHLIHEPTGVEVRMQDTKSQAQNREKAWRLLRARLYERQEAEARAARAEARNSMIGSGNRAEKIRTYRYKENLVVDHRLGSGSGGFNLAQVMNGHLQPLVDELVKLDTARRLASL